MTQQTRPNILFIMTDDHAAHAMSCYGSRVNTTPNLDRIAEDGMRFDNCFCTNSICTPSRAVILSGKHSHMTGVTTLRTHMDNRQENLAKILQRSGYQTGIVGKWHLGQGPEHWPTGFDHYNILQGQGPYFDPEMVRDGEKTRYTGYTTDIITDLALDWLAERDPERPFFLMYHHKAPHRPWQPDGAHARMYEDEDLPIPETFDDDYSTRAEAARAATMRIESDLNGRDLKLQGAYDAGRTGRVPLPLPDSLEGYSLTTDDGQVHTFGSLEELKHWKYQRYIKDYLRCVASVDDNVGRVLDWLDDQGLADNTIVIYTSDQGFYLGDHGWFDKRFMYEESLRMPFVMRFPDEIAPGSVCRDMVTNLDFAPTLLDYAGVSIPTDMQGVSFRLVAAGETPPDWQQSMYYRYWMVGGGHNVYPHYGVRTLGHKLIYYYVDPSCPEHGPRARTGEWELFDLVEDPFELNNVYGDPDYAEITAELKTELARLQTLYGDKTCE